MARSFQFVDQPAVNSSSERHVVRISAGLDRKRAVLQSIARQLRFPRYWGENWDALEDCLRDLSWWNSQKEIVFSHADCPFRYGSEARTIYLSILNDLADEGERSDGLTIRVCFPAATKSAVEQALQ